MSNRNEIEMTLITQRFVDDWVPQFPGLAIKYENRNFELPQNQPWVGFFIRSGKVAEAAISSIMPRGIGLVYLQIFLPENTGTLTARQYADAFADVFDNWHTTYPASGNYPQGDFWFKRVNVVMLPVKEGWLQWNCSIEFKHDEQIVTPLNTATVGGLPAGGTAGQALVKLDSVDYNAAWVTRRSEPLLVDLPDVSFPDNTTWVSVLAPTTYTLPTGRTGNTLIEVVINVKMIWTANSGSQAICDWSIDGGAHFQRTFHMLVNKQDDSTMNGIDTLFWQIAPDVSPTVAIVARQAVGPLGLAIVGMNNATWPALGSRAVIYDEGPIG